MDKQRIEVVWHDAADQPDTWVSPEDVEQFGDNVLVVTSIGYEIKRTKLYLTLVGDLTSEGDSGRVCKIPIGMIQSTKELTYETPLFPPPDSEPLA